MSELRMKKDGSGVASGGGSTTDATVTVSKTVSPTELISAIALVMLDEINALRTLGVIGLAAKTPEQIKTAIETKLAG